MPLILNHASTPPEGYQFADPSGVTLKAETLATLLTTIRDFRTTNGLPPGNPHAEVEAVYRVKHPYLVSKVGVIPPTQEDPVARWLSRLWRNPPKEKDFADSETGRMRLAQCVTCPHYFADHAYDASSARRLTIMSFARVTDHAACKAHHWPVGLACLLEKPPTIFSVEDCWAKATD